MTATRCKFNVPVYTNPRSDGEKLVFDTTYEQCRLESTHVEFTETENHEVWVQDGLYLFPKEN